jgi:amidase
MYELAGKSAKRIAELVRARAVSPVEVLEAFLRRVEDLNPSLNAIVTLAPDALEQARTLEAAIVRGEAMGPLCGVPLTIKDTFDVRGLLSTSGSRLRAGRVAERDAAAVERLRASGAIILGKTNVPEMALTYESENAVFGRTNNPHDTARTPGGSSGGEAASVAATLSAAGLGSDLVGSIRIPAHFCGIFGLKPTSGAVPGEGHCPEMPGRLAEAASFGPLSRTVEDLSLMFEVLAGLEQGSTLCELKSEELRGARVAWYISDGVTPVDEETGLAVERAARALAGAGCEMIEARPPGVERGHALWQKRFSPDVLRAVRLVYETPEDEEQAGEAVRALLSRARQATPTTEAERRKIDDECANLRRSLLDFMEETPILLAPVGAVTAFEHGTRKISVGGEEISVFKAFSYAQTFNTFNLPVVCVPAGRTRRGLPIGVQLVGRPFQEKALLRAACFLEEALGGWQPPGNYAPFSLS